MSERKEKEREEILNDNILEREREREWEGGREGERDGEEREEERQGGFVKRIS